MFRQDAWVRVNAGQRSEVRWEGQRVQAASNPLPGPELLPLLCLELLGPVSPLSSPHSLHFSEKTEAPSAFPQLSLCPSHLACPLQTHLRLTPPCAGNLLPSLNLGLSLWLPPLSLQGPPKEEHLESLVSPQMSSGEGVPARPLLPHTPPLLHPPTCPVFSLISSSQYLVSWDVLDPPAAPTQSLCLCPPPQALPHPPPHFWHLRLLLSPCACSHLSTPLPPATILELRSPVHVSMQTSLQASARLPSIPQLLGLSTANTVLTLLPGLLPPLFPL